MSIMSIFSFVVGAVAGVFIGKQLVDIYFLRLEEKRRNIAFQREMDYFQRQIDYYKEV